MDIFLMLWDTSLISGMWVYYVYTLCSENFFLKSKNANQPNQPTDQKPTKMDNFLTLWDIRLIFGIHTCHDNTLYSEKFFWNRMGPTSPTSLPAENLRKWITSTKIVRFGWDLVCKLVLLPYITLRNLNEVGPLFCRPARPTRKLTYRKNFKLL